MNFRRMVEADLPFFLEVRNECREWLHDDREFSLDQAIEWFKNLHPVHEYYIVEYEDQSIGYFRLRHAHKYSSILEIGADLHKNWRGKGLAFTAYQKFMQQFKADKYILEVLAHNLRAYNLYRKLGFTCYRLVDIKRDGRLIPSIRMELSK